MHGGFRPLIHPGTPADEIDVEGTKEERGCVNEQIRHQLRYLAELEAELAAGRTALETMLSQRPRR